MIYLVERLRQIDGTKVSRTATFNITINNITDCADSKATSNAFLKSKLIVYVVTVVFMSSELHAVSSTRRFQFFRVTHRFLYTFIPPLYCYTRIPLHAVFITRRFQRYRFNTGPADPQLEHWSTFCRSYMYLSISQRSGII